MVNSVTFSAVGDIALSHKYSTILNIKGADYPFEHVKGYFSQSDIVLANLEAPFCYSGKTYPLKCSLKAEPGYINGLKNAGISVVSLANNHILDYQEKAMYETIQLLNDNGIQSFGAGNNLEAARKPAIIERNGIKAGFLGYCDVVIDSPFYARENFRGISPFRIEYIRQDIQILRPKVDLLILSLHWGVENYSLPSPAQISIGHQLIELGVDLIIGHHPHVIQRVEKYKDAYIAYSLGNFIFSDIEWTWENPKGEKKISHVKLNKKNKESIIFTCTYNGKIKNADLLTTKINETLQVKVQSDRHEKIISTNEKRLLFDRFKWFLYLVFKKIQTYSNYYTRLINKIKYIFNFKNYEKN